MSFLTDNPVVGKTKELGDNLPLLGDRDKGKGRPSLTNPSKSQPAAGVVTTGGEVLSPGGGVLGTVIKGPVDSLVGKPVTLTGEVLDDDGQVVGEVQMIDLEQQDETHSNADSGVHGVMEEDNNPNPAEEGQRPETQKKWPELPISFGHAVSSNPGKQSPKPGADADPKTDVKQKKSLIEMVPVPEPEAKVDRNILAGKRVNKVGNVVDKSGMIFGRVVDGDVKRMVGRMCDKEGIVRSETGDEIGKAELVSESEREGLKEGPFAELKGCTVTKDAKVVTPGGDVVGRLVEGDGKKLFGRAVDEDGDICDKNGNILGHAERWEEPEVEKKKGPMAGRRVNKEGNVVDENGDLIGKLTTGELSICLGKEIDDDGDVVDSKGNIIGHASLLSDIPPTPEPSESPKEKEKREQIEQDKKLAAQMATCLDQCLDKIRPICRMITQILDKAERTPKEELDEEDVVNKVKPLLEEGSRILNEANGMVRGLDPDGRIAANAKHKTAAREAAPEEYRLADVLKELTGTVTECIENAKRKVEDMPHAKEQLNPLWGLLTEPLFQILAAVGLLLNGVLELVGRLLSGLGLGSLVENLLGGLGLTRLLEGLGLKGVVPALTGKK